MLIPEWINVRYNEDNVKPVIDYIEKHDITTVCEDALCPNRWTCYAHRELTFMILGNTCTRQCRFCGVGKGVPQQVDPYEAEKVLNTIKHFGSDYAVITSVTRDDLIDNGAGQFVNVIRRLKSNGVHVEVLIPDFNGNAELIAMIVNAEPDVIAHNIETVGRLYPVIRPLSDYNISLSVLETIKRLNKHAITKSGFMMGLGETISEVKKLMYELKETGCDILTVGQYLKPLPESYDVKEYIHPDIFKMIEEYGYNLGFKVIKAAPFVRSSFMARDMWVKTGLTQKNAFAK
jgi:lipoic acid synthetase